MDRTERLYKIDRLLHERSVVSTKTFLAELEISPATFKRDLEYLRDRMNAPIVWDREAAGYCFNKQSAGDRYELPGLWLSASEIYALLAMQQLLTSLGPGLLTPYIEPLLSRLRLLLDDQNVSVGVLEKRVRIQKLNARPCQSHHFLPIVTGVLRRRRLIVRHHNRYRNETIEREVSPQRLSHYQENWYLDAWCHLRNEVRRFALDSIRQVKLTDLQAEEMTEAELHAALDAGYGVFSGKALQWAELVFSSERARWVSQETWHPQQEGWFVDTGDYHLRVPFTDPRELSMNILRHLPDVKVIKPVSLIEIVAEKIKKAHANLSR